MEQGEKKLGQIKNIISKKERKSKKTRNINIYIYLKI